MTAILQKLLGLNWGTTLTGITLIIAAISRIALAYKTRDFDAIFADTKLIMETLIALLAGFGFLKAKDASVTGAGTAAKAVDSAGTVTNVEGLVVGQQPKL